MTEHEHHQHRELLGAYVLGQLSEDEAILVDSHLVTCDLCRSEIADLVPVATALADVRDASGDPRRSEARAFDAPEDLGDRVLAAVTDEQHGRDRARWVRAAAVAGVAAASAAAVLVVGLRLTAPDPAGPVPLEAVAITREGPQVDASAALVGHTWGIEVKLHATGFDTGGRYRVILLGTDGKRFPAGEFVGTGSREMSCNLNSSVLRDDARGFEVRDSAGTVVLASDFGG